MAAKFKADSRLWLTLDYRPLKIEQEIRNFWKNNHIPTKLMELRERANIGILGYVEGPPTLNGHPHIGHARGRVMKDLRYRFKTMQNFSIPFWAGWDCQGLPVELEVEKELDVKSKRELVEKVGEERFVAECKRILMRYFVEWFKADRKLGIFMNYDKAYWTYLDKYIEREWQYLKRAWDQGLLGEGYYVVAYCPYCQTSLSNAEVGLGYEEVEDPSIYFKLKVRGNVKEYFLVWTTMPFTIVTDMMLAVHPEAEYAKVRVNEEKWILAEERVDPVMKELEIKDYRVLETVMGKDLEGMKYKYPFGDMVPRERELDELSLVHTVICEGFVDLTTATGVVHLSPGCGEEDFLAAQKRNLPIFVPYDEEVRFTAEAGKFEGIFARDADHKVVDELRKRGLLVSEKTVRHQYPTCWRSHHKLIWLARREYFLWTNQINDKIMDAARKVNFFYEGPKNRFLSFLMEGKPWCVSRERVWGTPLPVWVCNDCGTKTLVASKRELMEKAMELPDQNFELHKPWIDRVLLKCGKCGGTMKREPFVLDAWHNSGASPYARFTDKEFAKFVPTDFLTEAIDQTRGWANTLLLEHVMLTEKPEAPYKSFLFQGHVMDAKGRKMSKSLGNVIEVNSFLQGYSADVCRFYLLWKCSPIESMNFDPEELRRRPRQVLSTLYHLHRFFMQNAEYDHFKPQKNTLQWADENNYLRSSDRWLLSRLQRTIKEVTEKLDNCEFHFALSVLEEFVVNVVSRQYVPMVRRDLWSDDPETHNRRLSVYMVLWLTLKTLVLLFNPIVPYLSENLYQKVYRELGETLPQSVNFENWPTPDEELLETALEHEFNTLLRCVSLVYSARQSAGLKRRWPLQKVVISLPREKQKALKNLEEVFLELTNVKKVGYVEEMPVVDSKRGQLVSDEDTHVLLYTHRDDALLGEGVMRDLARRVQALRKELGFVPTDILDAVHLAELDPRSTKLLEPYLEEMAELVRTKQVHVHNKRYEVEAEWHERRLDDKKVYIAII